MPHTKWLSDKHHDAGGMQCSAGRSHDNLLPRQECRVDDIFADHCSPSVHFSWGGLQNHASSKCQYVPNLPYSRPSVVGWRVTGLVSLSEQIWRLYNTPKENMCSYKPCKFCHVCSDLSWGKQPVADCTCSRDPPSDRQQSFHLLDGPTLALHRGLTHPRNSDVD